MSADIISYMLWDTRVLSEPKSHHSDGAPCKNLVRLEIQVEAIICFILSSPDKFPHVCATVGAPFSKLFIPLVPDWDVKRRQQLFFSTV